MKVLYVLASVMAMTQALHTIPGQDISFRAQYDEIGAPTCTMENIDCLLPDFDDNNYFYQCVEIGSFAVRQKCADKLWFDYGIQECQWPHKWHPHPRPPVRCSSTGPHPTRTTTTNGPDDSTTEDVSQATNEEIDPNVPTVPSVAPTAPTAAPKDDAKEAPVAPAGKKKN